MLFNLNTFLSHCVAAAREPDAQQRIANLVHSVVTKPSLLINKLGLPTAGKVDTLYVSDKLTVLNVVWAPGMRMMPHNHNMWAVIGVYHGCEENTVWHRSPSTHDKEIKIGDTLAIQSGNVELFDRDVIHSVTNPAPDFTGAIHVYGGDFFAVERSEWDWGRLQERPYNVEKNTQRFETR